jgi:hypothetical protein
MHKRVIQKLKYNIVHIEQISAPCALCTLCALGTMYPYTCKNISECTLCDYVHFVHPMHLVHPMYFGAIDSWWCIKMQTSHTNALLCVLCTHGTLRTLQPYTFKNAPECTFYISMHFVPPVHPVHPMYFRAFISWRLHFYASCEPCAPCAPDSHLYFENAPECTSVHHVQHHMHHVHLSASLVHKILFAFCFMYTSVYLFTCVFWRPCTFAFAA